MTLSKNRKSPLRKKSPRNNHPLKRNSSRKKSPLKRTAAASRKKKRSVKKRKKPVLKRISQSISQRRRFRAVLALSLVFLTVFCLYLFKLDRKIVSRFEGERWRLPSKIYSDTFSLYPGCAYKGVFLYDRLKRLGYQSTERKTIKQGEYFIGRGYIDIHLHDFLYPQGQFEGFPVRLKIKKGRIKNMLDLRTSKVIFSVDLEPELITGLFEQVWEERRLVTLKEVPESVINAVIAIEDRRFYQHMGLDFRAIVRAMTVNVKAHRIVQGASTLTQQLVKNFFLTPKRTLTRKAQEALMAMVLELRYSKDKILEAYLNEIYFGQKGSQGIYGVGEASKFYFGKSVKKLSLPESAVLAGLIRSPNLYSPHKDRKKIRKRRDHVLKQMRHLDMISEKQYRQASTASVEVRAFLPERNDAPYFVDYLVKELEREYSLDILTSEGLLIFTTLDIEMQRKARKSVQKGLARLEARYPSRLRPSKGKSRGPLQACLVALEPQTGFVRAMIGGRDYKKSQFNRVVQAQRQPGSLFKPIVFATALEGDHGNRPDFTPASLLQDEPIRVRCKDGPWVPRNFNDQYFGEVTLRTALEKSLNCATVWLSQQLELESIIETARRLGLSTTLEPSPSIVLGAFEAIPLEVASAFGAFANHGALSKPRAIKMVLDKDGDLLERKSLELQEAVSPEVAYLITNILKGVFERGTARSVAGKISIPVAGKTGTTNNSRDAWFAGYTPQLSALVWVGFDQPAGIGLGGSQAALPIWADFIKSLSGQLSSEDFLAPPGIERYKIDRVSGLLATSVCTETFKEAFIIGTEPKETCKRHPGHFSGGDSRGKNKGIVQRLFDLFR